MKIYDLCTSKEKMALCADIEIRGYCEKCKNDMYMMEIAKHS